MFTPSIYPKQPQQELGWLARAPEGPTGFFDRFGAEAALAWLRSPLHEIYGLNLMMANLNDVDQESITQDEWQRSAYYRPGLQYVPGMPWEYARLLAKRHDENGYYGSIIERGPRGPLAFAVGFAGSLVGGIPDPINFIPVTGIGYRGVVPLARMAGRVGIENKFMRRVLTGAANVGIATAYVQPAVAAAAREYQEDYDLKVLSSNLAFSVALGFGFGAVHAGVHRWSQNRIVAGLRKAMADSVTGRETNVAPALRDVPGEAHVPEPRKNPVPERIVEPPTAAELTPIDKIAAYDDATHARIAEMKPETAFGKRLQGFIAKIKDVVDTAKALGSDSAEAMKGLAEIQDVLGKNPMLLKALGDFDTIKDTAVGKTLDTIRAFGEYGVPAQDVIKSMPMKQLREVAPATHDMVVARVKAWKEDFDISEAPQKIFAGEGAERKVWKTESTRPPWMQELHKGNQPKPKRPTKAQRKARTIAEARGAIRVSRPRGEAAYLFDTYGTLVDAFDLVIKGEDDNIPAGKGATALKRTIEFIRAKAIREVTGGVALDEAGTWGAGLAPEETMGGMVEPHPDVVAELARMNGDIDIHQTVDPKMTVISEPPIVKLSEPPKPPVADTPLEQANVDLQQANERVAAVMDELKTLDEARPEVVMSGVDSKGNPYHITEKGTYSKEGEKWFFEGGDQIKIEVTKPEEISKLNKAPTKPVKPTIPEEIVKVNAEIKQAKRDHLVSKFLGACIGK